MKKVKIARGAAFLVGIILFTIGFLFFSVGLAVMLLVKADVAWVLGPVYSGLGSVLMLVGGAFLLVHWRNARRAEKLMAEGRFLWAEVAECVANYSVRINGRPAHQLIVRYVDGSGTVHTFRSHLIRGYVDPSVRGRKVKVYYRDESFRNYYVDMDGVLPTVVEH